MQGERLKYFYATTIVITVGIGILIYNYLSSKKNREEKKIDEGSKNGIPTFPDKKEIVFPDGDLNNLFQDPLDFKLPSDIATTPSEKTATDKDEDDPPTDLDGQSSNREEAPENKLKKKLLINERNKTKKTKAPSKGIYGNTAIKDDDPIRKLLLENKEHADKIIVNKRKDDKSVPLDPKDIQQPNVYDNSGL
uniref:Exported protein n=1 Tax=Parastrongyloides trichosuri TaxID=131310 RepID=A0A0N4ZFW7_PARTI